MCQNLGREMHGSSNFHIYTYTMSTLDAFQFQTYFSQNSVWKITPKESRVFPAIALK